MLETRSPSLLDMGDSLISESVGMGDSLISESVDMGDRLESSDLPKKSMNSPRLLCPPGKTVSKYIHIL